MTLGITESARSERGARTEASGIEIRLKTSPGRYRIRFEVGGPYLGSPVLLARDLDVAVPEAGEAPVTLALPE